MPATFPRRRAALLAMTGLAFAAVPAAAEPPWDGRSILCESCDSSTTDLAVASNGLSVVGWIDDGVVRAAIREAGDASFGAPLDISAKGTPTDISVAAGNRGEVIVAWRWREPGDELGGRIQARVISADGVAGPIEDLTQAAAAGTDPGGAARLTEVAIDGSGTAYAVWNRATVLGFRVESRVRPAAGAWGPHTFVSTHAARQPVREPGSRGERGIRRSRALARPRRRALAQLGEHRWSLGRTAGRHRIDRFVVRHGAGHGSRR